MPAASLFDRLARALSGRYALVRELGQGGMATVYLGTDLKLRRQVAIKLIPPATRAYVGSGRFQREILTVARLSHPHIVPLFEADEVDDFLFYVMEYVEGESLAERLEREGPLPVDDAVRIANEVADALQYAHDTGVIHCDIKPANILLSRGHAKVTDFGIAKLIAGQGNTTGAAVTQGAALGTPEYMSPEQARGRKNLDARTDIYSLSTVVYAMLAGEPPLVGPTVQSTIARVIHDPVPPIRSVRPDVPVHIERALGRALEKDPVDRPRTVQGFIEALNNPISDRFTTMRRRGWIALATAVAIAIAWIAASPKWGGGGRAAGNLDTSRYVIMPFSHRGGVSALDESQRLQDALTHWSGISVVDPFQVKDALAQHDSQNLTTEDARSVARGLGAGRLVRGEVSRIGDSIRVYASLYDVGHETAVVRNGAVKFARDLAQADSAFAQLAHRLLFGNAGPGARIEAQTGTTSLPALQAFVRGQAAIDDWDLALADSAFALAVRYDPGYAQAFLWIAQIRFWDGAPLATWQSAAERAAAGRQRLSSRDRLLSDAVVAFSRGTIERACRLWTQLTRVARHDFAAWYGAANCLQRDPAVVRDSTSPSGWRFRTSYHQALQAYERAFQLLPSIHRSLRGGSYQSVRRLLLTSGRALRPGRGLPPDTMTFAAEPEWLGDTLTLVPYPQQIIVSPRPVPPTATLAVRREREAFHNVVTAWVAAFPRSADALEALAISLDMLRDPSAIDTLRRARTFATTPEERIRVTCAEVWMRVRFSVPSDLAGLDAARALADSLLHAYPPPSPEPLLLASLAALLGRTQLAVAHSRERAASIEWVVPAPLTKTALPLLTFAALGGPVDSLRVLEQLVDSAIETALPASARGQARLLWVARAATLAFPDYRFRAIPKLAGSGDYLLDGQAALLRDDTAQVRRLFVSLRMARRFISPSEVTLDALGPEARLLAALGDYQGAAGWLDPTLAALSMTDPEAFTDPVRAGALVRAIALRTELAERLGDHNVAKRWARVVAVLWSDADPDLIPFVDRLRHLASSVRSCSSTGGYDYEASRHAESRCPQDRRGPDARHGGCRAGDTRDNAETTAGSGRRSRFESPRVSHGFGRHRA